MPYCPKCGKEVPADAKFCANCGAGLQEAVAPAASTGYTPPSALADLGSRIAAGIVDYIIVGVIAGILAVLLLFPIRVVTGSVVTGVSPGWFGGGVFVVLILGFMWLFWLIYFTYFEGTSGQTIGKKLTHIKVIREDGSKCDFGSALVRNILRIIDHLPFLYLLGIILIVATDKRQRLGDMLAKTLVVKS